MQSKQLNSADESSHDSALPGPDDPFFVPSDRSALVIRNGVPEQFFPPGLHPLPLGQAKVEVRLLSVEASQLPALAPPDARALTLPYERSFLHLDGDLVGILEPSPTGAAESTPVIQAWEGFQPTGKHQVRQLEALRACLGEPLRSCFPASGICCGARLSTATGAR